jgi:branched-subunit amino acid transport protein AzlD
MILSPWQTFIIICMVCAGTMITRFLPFILFRGEKANHPYIRYLGQVLPYSVIGFLVVYCLRGVNLRGPAHGIPEAIAVICITVLHYWKENTLLSIGVGTIVYMVLVQNVFI